jgi:PBP1b-binding outer membrane lipoprotein LpoB
MRRYVVILGLALASLGCSEDEEKGEFADSTVGPTVSVQCDQSVTSALEPAKPDSGSSRIEVACERAQ